MPPTTSSSRPPAPLTASTDPSTNNTGRNSTITVTVENLGVLRHAEFELGDLTVICGRNNTGKTYATYALFGFLEYWKNNLQVTIPPSQIIPLLKDGVVRIDLTALAAKSTQILESGCRDYTRQLSRVFASKPTRFQNSRFRVKLQSDSIQKKVVSGSLERNIRSNKGELFSLTKNSGETYLVVSLLANNQEAVLPRRRIDSLVSDAINDIFFGSFFPRPFIASAERTGAAVFQKELYFSRNNLLKEMSHADKDIDPMKLLFTAYQDYPLPINVNVDFTQRLGSVAKRDSFLSNNHPWVLDEFAGIVGGRYEVANNTLYFRPFRVRRRLTLVDSSSAVRSLLDVWFYLHHIAEPGDLLMIDEPELNLHPENQRQLARLFARLVNLGVRVFVTTHSDYIVKELNTLIMLNQNTPNTKRIAKQENYRTEDFLSPDATRVYMAERSRVKLGPGKRTIECQTLVRAPIDARMGIEARSFDDTINKMNDIQEAIVWGDDE